MRSLRSLIKSPTAICSIWIAACFSLTSAVWISWEYHLLSFVDPTASDIFSMVLGYLLQAAGVLITILLSQWTTAIQHRKLFLYSVVAFIITAIPSLLSHAKLAVILSGLLMNLLCGVIGGFYLLITAMQADERKRSLAFGCGYGISSLVVFLLSLIGENSFLQSKTVLIVYILFAGLSVWIIWPMFDRPLAARSQKRKETTKKDLGLALLLIMLLSLVKNLGFSFPSTDIHQGVNMEFTRVFYGLGLIVAGFVNDRNRKHGAICTAAALAIPFVMLSLSGETIPSLIFWALGYVFFAFYSVFRVTLFMDMAAMTCIWFIAPFGLFAGRIGDALGTAICIGLSDSKTLLIVLTLCLFVVTVFLFFRFFQILYMPEAVREKSEQEVFEGFSIQHDLSAREKEVLRLVLAEQSNTQIAETLFVSESTIKYHVHNLLQKTGCKSRQDLVKKYNLALYPGIEDQ